jgi:hypothetical protein
MFRDYGLRRMTFHYTARILGGQVMGITRASKLLEWRRKVREVLSSLAGCEVSEGTTANLRR